MNGMTKYEIQLYYGRIIREVNRIRYCQCGHKYSTIKYGIAICDKCGGEKAGYTTLKKAGLVSDG